jgi:hypothetical protein
MINRLSVSALLKAVIATFSAALVIMLALDARESAVSLSTANRISSVANVSTYMFRAMNGLRVDRASTQRDLLADRQQATIEPLLKDSRDSEMSALNGLLTALAAADFPDRDQALADFAGRTKRLAELQQRTAAALAQPKRSVRRSLHPPTIKRPTA